MSRKLYTPVISLVYKIKGMGKFFAYFIIVNLLVTGFMGTLLYLRSSTVLSKDNMEVNQNMLIQLNKSIDVIQTQVDRSLLLLSLDPDISNFMEYYKSKDYPMLMKTRESLNNIMILNSYVHSIDVYYARENKVFRVNTGVFAVADFADRDIIERINNSKTKFEWIPSRNIFDEKTGKNINVITVVKPIPQVSYEPNAYAIINIDENYLRGIMNSIIKKKELGIYIVNNNRQIVAYNSNSSRTEYNELVNGKYLDEAFSKREGNYLSTVKNEEMMITFLTSELNGWKYISIIPDRVITQKIEFIKNYAVVVSIIAIVIGFIMSLFFSNRIYSAINTIAKLFLNTEQKQDGRDTLKYIESSVNRLLEKNRSIESVLESNMPILKNNFINSVLKGNITDRSEIEEKLAYYKFDFGNTGVWCVYVIGIDSSRSFTGSYSQKQTNMLVIYLLHTLNDLLNESCNGVVVNTKENEIALIARFSEFSDDSLLKQERLSLGKSIKEAISGNEKQYATVAAGRVYNDITCISESYSEAVDALQYRFILGSGKVILFEEIEEISSKKSNYPFKKESELISALKQGDLQAVEKMHKAVLESFINSRDGVPGNSGYYHYMQLLCSVMKSAFESGMDVEETLGKTNLFEDLLSCKSTDEINEWFRQIYTGIVKYIESRRGKKSSNMVETIETYIMANYNKNLSLYTLSQMVYLSIPYLSKVFKEEKGKSLKQFINEVRMEKAKSFLKNPEFKISEVGEKVGYDKVHGFLKLFKEYTGMTPGEYRASIRREDDLRI